MSTSQIIFVEQQFMYENNLRVPCIFLRLVTRSVVYVLILCISFRGRHNSMKYIYVFCYTVGKVMFVHDVNPCHSVAALLAYCYNSSDFERYQHCMHHIFSTTVAFT